MKKLINNFVGILLLAGVVFGLFIVVIAPFEISKMVAAANWPSRKAAITKSYARYMRGNGRNYLSYPWWKPEICGAYRDNGELFCISRVRYGKFRFGEGKAACAEVLARYPVGREVNVYYSPVDPKETILESRPLWNDMIILMSVGIVMLLLPVLLWVFRKKIEPGRYGGD